MGTTKRERQKSNRHQRLEQMARQARRDKTRRRTLRIAIFVGGGVVLLFGAAYLFGDKDEDAVPTSTIAPVITNDVSPTVDPGPTTTTDPDAPTTTAAPTTTVVAAFAYGAGACPEPDGSSVKPDAFEDAPEQCIDPAKIYTADVVTSRGSFTIALDAAKAPGNVNNFVTLARYGYYDNTDCHRVIKDFVVQCGRPGTDETAPGYSVPDELPGDGEFIEGMVAMANTGAPNTGGGQWFIIVGEGGTSLPAQYSIVGTVTVGYNSTVAALENLADPIADNGVPPLLPITIKSVTITEA